MKSRRGRPKWRNIPFNEIFGRIGLQRHDGDSTQQAEGVTDWVNRRDLEMKRDAPQTATKTLLDIIVQDPNGQVIGQTTLDSLPTGDATISFPFGQITLASTGLSTQPSVPSPSPSSSLSIQLPSSSSQQVLSSSPPPTPNPSSARTSGQSSSQLPSSSPQSPITSSPPAASTTPRPAASTLGGSNSTSIRTTHAASTRPALTTSLGFNSTTFATLSQSASSSSTGFRSSSSSTFSTHSPSSTFSTSTITSSSSSFSSSTSSFLSSTQTESASSTSAFASETGNGGAGGGGAAPTGTQAAPAASTTAASGGAAPVNVPVVGGVVGGLAGFALLLALLLFFLRWRRRKIAGARQLPSSADGDNDTTRPGTGGSSGPMTQRSTSGWGAAGVPPLFKKMRPHSQATTETAPSERGFQKISGRKLESVLTSGGDGYGGPSRPSERNMSGSSFYRDSQGTYGGPAASAGTSMNVGPASNRQSGAPSSNYEVPRSPPPDMPDRSLSASPPETVSSSPPEAAIMRPGPARTPVHQPGFSNTRPGGPLPPGLSPVPPRVRQDGIGRSHASMDGSRDSRGSRFAEDFT